MEGSCEMKVLIGISLFGSVVAAALPAYAQVSDPEAAAFECELTGECGEEAAPAAEQASEPARSGARTGSTRGFTFQRQTPQGSQTQTTRRTSVASAQMPENAAQVIRAADLKLTFLPGSAALTEGAKARLAKYATVLASPKLAGRKLRIEGHTDASGSARLNLDLSRKRAQAVADFLAASGVDASRVDVVGYGSSKPLPGMAPQAAANRRVMAVLL
jgi:OOP family OmpA-OmpF porin